MRTAPRRPVHRNLSREQAGVSGFTTTMLLGHHLDLASPVPAPPTIVPESRTEAKRFLGVRFDCCGVYSRIYRTRAGDAYVGHCPKCAKRVQFNVGPGGSDARFFSVG